MKHPDRTLNPGNSTCRPCRSCADSIATPVDPCPAGSVTDTTTGCLCPVGYYGADQSFSVACVACKVCHAQARTAGVCVAGSVSDVVACTCNAGYYGDGTTCQACKKCDARAQVVNPCAGGSASDTSSCQCNAGYYGDGVTCQPCKKCDSHAQNINPCASGSVSDTSSCLCNAGYYGNGLTCTICAAGYYSFAGLDSRLA